LNYRGKWSGAVVIPSVDHPRGETTGAEAEE